MRYNMNRKEIEKYINENYDVLQEYPWNEYPHYTTFKHKNNKKCNIFKNKSRRNSN